MISTHGVTLPDPNEYDNEKDWMTACVPKMITEGKPQDQAVAACSNMWTMKGNAAKFLLLGGAVKAVGDWKLEVRGVPFGTDGDHQTFDSNTDYMLDSFPTPAVIYQHGLKPGAVRDMNKQIGWEKTPVIIGKTISIEKRNDGIYFLVLLDKTIEYARRVWEAAKLGLAVASSDSIMHLARLDVGNNHQIMYEKDRSGRVTVWPIAGISLWDKVTGNATPASPYAIALPAMKAMYREAGIPFPKLTDENTKGATQAKLAKRRAEIVSVSKKLLKAFEANGDKHNG